LPGSILVISHDDDIHAREVLRHLETRGAEAVVLDTGRIPRETAITLAHDPEGAWRGSMELDGRALALESVRSVWWRRPRPYGLHDEIGGAEDRHFAYAETNATMAALWSLLDANWVNDPDRDEKAGRKGWQLKLAREVGLTIPRTCITSDPQEARRFVASAPAPIAYKAFQGTERSWRETRLLKPEETELLDAVRFAPVIFQEYIPARVDLRVTIVGERIFAAEIDSQATAYPHDFRMDMGSAAIAEHILPAAIAENLHALMSKLGLVYGAIDMRQTPGGEYVFLEVNPAGQWLFVEQQTGQPIAAAIAETLIEFAT
jgi:glutathione synthase/RimK-type ligase-like ATP-grasp enzyme